MVLIDSSSWIESLRQSGRPEVRTRVQSLLTSGQAAWCDIIRLEIWNGARGDHEKKVIRQLQSTVVNLRTTDEVWGLAVTLAERARDVGLTVPAADLVIVACAHHHRVALEHCDQHLTKLQTLLP